MQASRCWVSGRVQGVWYRGTTARKAAELGLQGYAKNLADGRVEVLAVGEADAIKRLQVWLWEGPVAADVTGVDCESLSETPTVEGFQTY